MLLAALVTLLFSALPAIASAGTALSQYEQQLVQCINLERAQRGLPQLRVNPALVTSARAHSADMGQRKYFEHNVPGGETWQARVIRSGYAVRGYRIWKAGEDIYWGAGLEVQPSRRRGRVDALGKPPRRHPRRRFLRYRRRRREAPDGGGAACWHRSGSSRLDAGVRAEVAAQDDR